MSVYKKEYLVNVLNTFLIDEKRLYNSSIIPLAKKIQNAVLLEHIDVSVLRECVLECFAHQIPPFYILDELSDLRLVLLKCELEEVKKVAEFVLRLKREFALCFLEEQSKLDLEDTVSVKKLFEFEDSDDVMHLCYGQIEWLEKLIRAIIARDKTMAPELDHRYCAIHKNLRVVAQNHPEAYKIFDEDRFDTLHKSVHLEALSVFDALERREYESVLRHYYGLYGIYKLNISIISTFLIHNLSNQKVKNDELKSALDKKTTLLKDFFGNDQLEASNFANLELKKEISLIESIIENTPVPIYFKSPGGFYVGCNKEFVKFFAQNDKNAILGKSIHDFVGYENALIHESFDAKLLNGEEESLSYEDVFYCGEEKKYAKLYKTLINIEEGDYDKLIVGAILDMTENKNLQDALFKMNKKLQEIADTESKKRQKSQQKYKSLFNGVPYQIIVAKLNQDHTEAIVVEVNSPVVDFLGFERDDFLGKSLSDVCNMLTDDNGTFFSNKIYTLKNTAFAVEMYKKDKTPVSCRVNIYYGDIDGEEGIYVNISDASEEKHLLKKIDRVVDSLNDAYRLARIGSWSYETKSGVFVWSDELAEILGISSDTENIGLGQFLERFVDNDAKREFSEKIEFCLKNGESAEMEHRFQGGDGKVMYLKSKAVRRKDEDGKELLIGYSQDITKQKEIEDKQKEQEKLLMQQSKMAAMGNMVAAISHQLRQPLNSISLLAAILQDEGIEAQKSVIEKIDKQVDFMNDTIESFRNFFKPDRSEALFSVKECIEDVLAMVSYQMKNNYIALVTELNDDVSVLGLKNDFKQVVLNIVVNAKDSILNRMRSQSFEERKEGKISIAMERSDRYCVIKIGDNGTGIAEEHLKDLFKEYFTTKGDTGTGIGLHLSKMIIEEKMGGTIEVKNNNEGAEFIIMLPL